MSDISPNPASLRCKSDFVDHAPVRRKITGPSPPKPSKTTPKNLHPSSSTLFTFFFTFSAISISLGRILLLPTPPKPLGIPRKEQMSTEEFLFWMPALRTPGGVYVFYFWDEVFDVSFLLFSELQGIGL